MTKQDETADQRLARIRAWVEEPGTTLKDETMIYNVHGAPRRYQTYRLDKADVAWMLSQIPSV